MAFGYPQPDQPKFNIDYNRYQPVSVIANYNADGKIMPVYMSVSDDNEESHKIKIDGIKYTKYGNGCITYCCVFNNGRRKQQVNLTFFIHEHVWVIAK